MKSRHQRVDLRSFLGTEVPLGQLTPDLRQRARHLLAGHGDDATLASVAAAVTRELLAAGVFRPAGTLRDGVDGVVLYSMPHSTRVYDLRALLGESQSTPRSSALDIETQPSQREVVEPERPPQATAPPLAAPEPRDEPTRMPPDRERPARIEPDPPFSVPDDRPSADPERPSGSVVPIEAIRRTIERDWVSFGLDSSLEGVLEHLAEGLGDEGMEFLVFSEDLDLGSDDGAHWRRGVISKDQDLRVQRAVEAARSSIVQVVGRRWLGVYHLENAVGALGVRRAIAESDLRMAVSTVEALLLAHRRSQQRVYTDPLTGLNNRSFFQHQIGVELERAQRQAQPLGLLFVDIDHFKRVNDSLGHDIGDLVLQHVARLMVEHLRRIDQVFRWGGEEFALLLPSTGRGEAEYTAERLRCVIEETPLRVAEGKNVMCTVSIGVAMAPEHARGGERELLRHADQALYRAKETGRNRVVVYDTDM